ncbi:hypothetical protein [Streptomyces sp. cmx-4-7]|uniref:hypothetical protein n=1 Tax=Streptomyces sp. cmx-4-7 TaxID=2790939 RepID=UPI00398182AE
MRAAMSREPTSGGAAANRIAEALGAPNVRGQKAAVSSFVVRRFITRGLLVDLSGNPKGTLHQPGQVTEVCARGNLAELVAADAPLGPDQAADHLPARRVEYDWMVELKWIRPPKWTEVEYGTSRAGAVDVPLYRTADADAPADVHPEIDREELRQVEKGRRSSLAALRPKTKAKAAPAQGPGGREVRPPGPCAGAGHRPLAGLGVRRQEDLRLLGAAAGDDLDAAVVLAGHRDRADLGNEHPPGVQGVAHEDAGGEVLPHLRAADRAGGGGLRDEENVEADPAAHEQDLRERVDGRGLLRVAGLADPGPVPLELRHRRVDLFEEDHQPGPDPPRLAGQDVVGQLPGQANPVAPFLGEAACAGSDVPLPYAGKAGLRRLPDLGAQSAPVLIPPHAACHRVP